jgi:GntR family transcriptional regulator
MVTRRTKVGTTVSGAVRIPVDEVMTVAEFPDETSLEACGQVLESQVIRAPAIVSERLQLPPDALVLVIEGVIHLGGAPVALSVSYVALTCEQQAHPQVEVPDAIAFLEERLQVCVGPGSTTVGALTADAQTARLLDVAPGSALLWLEDLLRDEQGRPRALSQFRFRSDRVVFSASVHRRLAR